LLEEENPFSPINRRISILVMSRDAEARLSGAGRTPLTPRAAPAAAAPEKP
jgi:chemotaxis protein MotB